MTTDNELYYEEMQAEAEKDEALFPIFSESPEGMYRVIHRRNNRNAKEIRHGKKEQVYKAFKFFSMDLGEGEELLFVNCRGEVEERHEGEN